MSHNRSLSDCFNPRSRAGSDPKAWIRSTDLGVSIHAPARGATMPLARSWSCFLFQSTLPRGERPARTPALSTLDSFNPRSRAGSDGEFESTAKGHLLFQSTLPRGERLFCVGSEVSMQGFNPRSRAGSDRQFFCLQRVDDVSIHAPARGATNGNGRNIGQMGVSIHAPARGATKAFMQELWGYEFQSTLPRGERLLQSM